MKIKDLLAVVIATDIIEISTYCEEIIVIDKASNIMYHYHNVHNKKVIKITPQKDNKLKVLIET